jgi:hypothetical protein
MTAEGRSERYTCTRVGSRFGRWQPISATRTARSGRCCGSMALPDQVVTGCEESDVNDHYRADTDSGSWRHLPAFDAASC